MASGRRDGERGYLGGLLAKKVKNKGELCKMSARRHYLVRYIVGNHHPSYFSYQGETKELAAPFAKSAQGKKELGEK